MVIAQIVILSLLVGSVAAGFVWYGAGLAQNVRALSKKKEEKKERRGDETEKPGTASDEVRHEVVE